MEAPGHGMPHFSRPDGYFLPSNAADPPTAKYLLPLQSKGLTFVSLGAKQGKGAKGKASAEVDQEGRHSSRGSPLPSGARGTLLGVADAMGGAMRRYSNLQGKLRRNERLRKWYKPTVRLSVVNSECACALVTHMESICVSDSKFQCINEVHICPSTMYRLLASRIILATRG